VKTALRWIASLALLAAALVLLDWTSLLASATRLTLWGFLFAVLLACVQFVPLLVRWYRLAGAEGTWYACSARYLYANLLNAISPGNLGGDVYRFFAFRSTQRSGATLVGILLRERLLGLASMLSGLMAGVIGMELSGAGAGETIWRLLGVAAAAGLAVLSCLPRLLAWWPVPQRWRDPLRDAIRSGSARGNASLVGWSLLALGVWVATVQFVAARLGVDVPWHVLVAIVTSAELIRIVPITIQGLGLREGAYAALFGLAGYAAETGFVLGATAYLAHGAALVITGALGAAMLAREDRRS
jgi:glycosyltransferase 2 family protein